MTIKHGLHDIIGINDAIIEDYGFVQRCFVKKCTNIATPQEYGYLVRSEKYSSIFYEMSAIDMNTNKIKETSRMNSKSIIPCKQNAKN